MNKQTLYQKIPALLAFYQRYTRVRISQIAAQILVGTISVSIIVLLAAFLNTSGTMRIAILTTWPILIGIFSSWIVLKNRKYFDLKVMCRILEKQSDIFRDLLNAAELAGTPHRDGVSVDLKDALIENIQARLNRENPGKWLELSLSPFLKQLGSVVGIALLLSLAPPRPLISGWNQLLHGAYEELLRNVRIVPEGAKIVSGESIKITAELLQLDRPAPRLFVEGSEEWEEIEGATSGRMTTFQLKSITAVTSYKVRWGKLESRIFEIVPVDPPRLTNFNLKLTFPDYTRSQPKVLNQEPQLKLLRGTKVEVEARVTKPLNAVSMVTSAGIRYPVHLKKKDQIAVDFMVNNPFEFWFEMEDEDGVVPVEPVRYAVSVQEDQYPQVRLLAPSTDLLVGKESKLPFTFEIKDDIGITAVFLRISGNERESQRIPLKRYGNGVTEKIDESEFRLSSVKTAGKEILKMQLEVQDNDTVTGPKSGFSDTILVEIQSYERQHEQIQKELKEMQKELMDLLAQQSLARLPDEKWKGLSEHPDQLNQKMNETLQKQSQAIAQAEQVEKKLSKTLEKMESDPLSDLSVWSEHQGIRDSLQNLREGAMSQAQQKFSEKNVQEAVQQQDQAIAELERLAAVSEDMEKYSNMKDAMHGLDRLHTKAEELESRLSKAETLDDKMMKLLQETLKEAFDILSAIQKQLKDQPQDLPEEFVNQPAVKDADLNPLAKSADDLAKALMGGNLQAALKAARDLLQQAKSARDAISKAGEDVSYSGMQSLSKKSSEAQGALQKLIERQEKLLERTNTFEAKRFQFMLDRQRKLLEELARMQRKVLNDSQELSGDLHRARQLEMISLLGPTLPTMEKVLKELESRNVMFSQKWLEEIIARLAYSQPKADAYALTIPTFTASPEDDLNVRKAKQTLELWHRLVDVKEDEETILDKLKNPVVSAESPFSPEDEQELAGLGSEQGKLADDTKALGSDIMKLAGESALVDPKVIGAIGNASKEMKSAQGSLGGAKTETAQQQQEKALSHLREGQEGMQGMSQKLGKMGQSLGQGQPSLIQRRNGGSDGQTGIRQGVVPIPRAEDYLPPKEFREEILNSLKERYPKSQEDLIKDYYKKLTQ